MRGLRHVAEALKAAGHTVVDWEGTFRYETTNDLITKFWFADGGEGRRFRLTYCPFQPLMSCSQEDPRRVGRASICRYRIGARHQA
jgi:hypothetical protein